MSNFKVGDKVRLKTGSGPIKGAVGTITADDRSSFRPLMIAFSKPVDGHSHLWRGHEELELVKAAPKARSKVKPEPAPEAPTPAIPPRFVVVFEDNVKDLTGARRLREARTYASKDTAVTRAKEVSTRLRKATAVLQVVAEVSIEHVPATTKVTVKEI